MLSKLSIGPTDRQTDKQTEPDSCLWS